METIKRNRRILNAIERNYGVLKPELVVLEAMNPRHPWHEQIWAKSDDETADFRLDLEGQLDVARHIIRSVANGNVTSPVGL
jgi:hypothetical protein